MALCHSLACTICCAPATDCAMDGRRNVRRESMKQLDKHEKDGDVSEDEKKAYENSIQELTDDYVKQIDKLVKGKQDELSKV